MEDKRSFIEKLRSIKHIDIIIAVLVLAIVLVVYFTCFTGKKDEVIALDSSSDDFVHQIEDVLSSIDGVGDAKVVINYADDAETVIAMREESHTKVNKDGITESIESSREPIIVRVKGEDKPIILRENKDSIEGVVVVAKGARDPRIRLSIIDAMSTLLQISRDKIKVYDMK